MKSLSKGRIACAVLVAAVAGLGIASAAGASGRSLPQGAFYIYSDLGPGNAYYCCDGWTVSGSSTGAGYFESAMSFTPSSNAHVTQIDVALGHSSGANNATIELAQDNGGIPGTVLGSWNVSGQPALGTCCALTTIHTSLIPVAAGSTYWVLAMPGSNNTSDGWNFNTVGAAGGAISNGKTWFFYGNPTGAYDVIGCGKICKVTP